jgi:hypothetical protein
MKKYFSILILVSAFGCQLYSQSWTTYTTANGLSSNKVVSSAVDAQGNKWLGTYAGVSEFDGANWVIYAKTNGLTGNIVNSIAIDMQENKWFCTNNGVSKFDGTKWTSYTTINGLVNNNVNAIGIDIQGNKWFGTYGSGVSEFNGTTWTTYTTDDGLADNYINAIAIDAQGNKWFGTDGSGISEFDGTTWTSYSRANGLASNYVMAIAIDAQGSKWFATFENGVSKYDGTTWTTYNTTNGLADNLVWGIAIDSQGNKWFGTNSGVSKFDGTNWTNYTSTDGLVNDTVHSIAIDLSGNRWFGTTGGVSKLSLYSLNVSTDSLKLGSFANETGSFIISSNTNWNVSADNNMITLSKTSGSNNDTIHISVAHNPDTSIRTARVYVSSIGLDTKAVVIAQAGTKKPYQIINYQTISPKTYGDQDFKLSATSTSGLTVSYICSDTNVISISNGMAHIKKAGTCNIKALQSGDNNYFAAPIDSQVLVVNKKQLYITADYKEKTYGSANPLLTMKYSGFANKETESSIVKPTISTSATKTSNAGIYSISLSGGSSGNYQINLQNNYLNINKAMLFALAESKSKKCGDPVPANFKISYIGFVNSEDTTVLITKPRATTKATKLSNTGEYKVTMTEGTAYNYDINYINGILTVLPKGPTYKYITLCKDSVYKLSTGKKISASGTYNDTLVSKNGCDSLLIINIVALNPLSATKNETICIGSEYKVGNKIYTKSGTYQDTLKSNNCDSLYVTTILKVDQIAKVNAGNDTDICKGGSVTLVATGTGNVTWNGFNSANIQVSPQATTFYTATAKSACNKVSDDVTVRVSTAPDQPTIYQNGRSLFTNSSSSNVQWYLQPGGAIDKATDWKFTPEVSGDYYAVLSNGTCSSKLSNVINFTFVVSINENENSGNPERIFPNPVSNELFIEGDMQISKIEIINSIGNSIFKINSVGEEKFKLDASQWQTGVYFVKLWFGDRSIKPYIKAVIKQ